MPPSLVAWMLKQISEEWQSAPRRKGGGGGRYTNPAWTKTKLVSMSPATLRRLNVAAKVLSDHAGVKVYPMQVAAMLIEHAALQAEDER